MATRPHTAATGAGPILVLVDPAAGGGRAQSRLDEALRAWPGGRPGVRVADVRDRAELLARYGAAAGAVVAAGGDGTVAAVAAALLAARLDAPLGVLPLGTGNAFAHAMGVGRLPAAVNAIAAGACRVVDVMRTDRAEAPVALVSISTGFEGRLIERYGRHRRRGRLAGAACALSALLQREDGIALAVDGCAVLGAATPVFSAGLYNMRTYGGGWVAWPEADPGDGRGLAVVAATRRSYLRALAGGHSACRRAAWSHAVLESRSPIQVDGDSHAPGCIAVRIDPGALRVLVP
jgi:diacylglycerol kinase (ATP)